MKMDEQTVVANIIKIRNIKGFTKRQVAKSIGINEASYGRIESGDIALSYNHLALIASCFGMTVIDIITHPMKYTIISAEEEPVEAVLQIRLRREKQDQVLKLVFGENNLEILNK